tara:strand:- start:778 stop:954 length:177 start_codon:yes stop_codon:yes gene_type:complete
MNKRITLPVSEELADIREKLSTELGIKMTYNQVIDYLIHFYLTRTQQPDSPHTQWRHI